MAQQKVFFSSFASSYLLMATWLATENKPGTNYIEVDDVKNK